MHSLKERLPSPVAAAFHSLAIATGGVRPNYLRALNHLIDAAELYTQMCASVALSLLGRSSRTPTAEFSHHLDIFLKTPLNLGHWLNIWKRSAEEVLRERLDDDRSFECVARFILDQPGQQRTVLADIDRLPALRNRKRGHTFTLSESDARAVVESNRPLIEGVISSSEFLWNELVFVVARDSDAPHCELALLRGNVSIGQADTALITTNALPEKGTVLAAPVLQLEAKDLPGHALLPLSPLIISKDEELFIYQGARGGTAFYLSQAAHEYERPLSEVRNAYAHLLPTAGPRKKPPKPPAWADGLRHHDVLSEAAFFGVPSHPAGFFRGNVPSWSDLQDDFDVRRTLIHAEASVSPETFYSRHLPNILARAREFDVPIVLFTGPGGSGKTTHLLRCAFQLFLQHASEVVVLRHWIGSGLDPSDYQLASRSNPGSVIAVFIDEASAIAPALRGFRMNLQHLRIPLAFFCAERPNLWPDVPCDRYDLIHLDERETTELLARLHKANALGTLAALSPLEQQERLRDRYGRQLLVTLREATEGERFDDIIENEYRSIPNESARDVYLLAALAQRSGHMLPEEAAMVAARVRTPRDLKEVVRKPCQGVLVRETAAYGSLYYRARHRIIAEVLCGRILPSADDEAEELAMLVGVLLATERRDQESVATTMLAAAENSRALELGDLRAFGPHLRSLSTRLPRFLLRLLEQHGANHGVRRLIAAVLGQGLHDGLGFTRPALVRIVQKLTESMEATELAACLEASLSSSTLANECTDYLLVVVASIYEHAGDIASCCRICESELGRVSTRVPVLVVLKLAAIYRGRSNWDAERAVLEDAISRLEAAPQTESGQQHLYISLASRLRHRGDFDAARSVLSRGVLQARRRNNLGLGEIYVALAYLDRARGDLGAAIELLTAGLDDLPEGSRSSRAVLACLAMVLRERGSPELALKHASAGFQKALRKGPIAIARAYLNMIAVYVAAEDTAGARAFLESGLRGVDLPPDTQAEVANRAADLINRRQHEDSREPELDLRNPTDDCVDEKSR